MTIKKLIINLFAATALMAGAPAAHAQHSVGEWTIYSVFSGDVTDCVEGPTKVYYVSDGSLYSFDKETSETYTYSIGNKLNDNNIRDIYYNAADHFLVVAYESGNMDMLYDNGKVVNLSDIKDANISSNKVINDIAFGGGKMYVATDFGIVVYDTKNHNVTESGIYKNDIGSIAVVGDRLVIYNATTKWLMQAPLSGRHVSLDVFKTMRKGYYTSGYVNWMQAANDRTFMVGYNNNVVFSYTCPEEVKDEEWCTYKASVLTQSVGRPQTTADGKVLLQSGANLKELQADATFTDYATLPAELQGQLLQAYDGAGSVWALDSNGLANYDITDGNLTVLSDKAKPAGTSTVKNAVFMARSNDGSRIYVSNVGQNTWWMDFPNNGIDVVQTTDVIVNGQVSDAAIFDCVLEKADAITAQKKHPGDTRMYGGPERIVVDPENPNRYYIGNFLEGLYVVEDNKEVFKFDARNMPASLWWSGSDKGGHVMNVNFDPAGNLWAGLWQVNGGDVSSWMCLPKEKLRGDLSAVTKADWQMEVTPISEYAGDKDMVSLFSKDGMLFTWDRKYAGSVRLRIYNTKKTWSNTSDDVYEEIKAFTDQDGNSFQPNGWYSGIEDARGRIWLGCDRGIVEITQPGKVLDPDFRLRRLKVPRNDGTPFADYLLESERINAISCDAANRKWVATAGSGVYLVSEDGDKILEHFTSENSPLPGNEVFSVMCDPLSNMVYFGLPTGLVSYSSTSAPAADTYDEVYAYPNPVRPDYTGWITIKGLKANSLVKIADAAGNVFHQGRSDGGMYVWDGCNANGERVRSGVYFVYASQNADGTNSGVVTKILVVN